MGASAWFSNLGYSHTDARGPWMGQETFTGSTGVDDDLIPLSPLFLRPAG